MTKSSTFGIDLIVSTILNRTLQRKTIPISIAEHPLVMMNRWRYLPGKSIGTQAHIRSITKDATKNSQFPVPLQQVFDRSCHALSLQKLDQTKIGVLLLHLGWGCPILTLGRIQKRLISLVDDELFSSLQLFWILLASTAIFLTDVHANYIFQFH